MAESVSLKEMSGRNTLQLPLEAFHRGRRHSSTTRFLTVPKTTELTGKRVAFDLDFDMSTLHHSMSQRTSLESSYRRLSISPRPSLIAGSPPGKKVAFFIEPSPRMKSEATETVAADPHLKTHFDAASVIRSLLHKDQSGGSTIRSFMSPSESNFAEDHQFELLTFGEDYVLDEGSSSEHLPKINVSLKGNLFRIGIPQPTFRALPAYRYESIPNSQRVSLGTEGSYLDIELWPWPWLHPEAKGKPIYRHPVPRYVTFSRQFGLPVLPLPSLGKTLTMYLQSVRPCVRPRQFEVIEKIVKEFAVGEGKLYQQFLLKNNDEKMKSWIKKFIPNYCHLFSRQEAVLLSTGIIAPFANDLWPEHPGTQIQRAAILIELAIEFWHLVRTERLNPITDDDGHVACMHSFRKLFCTTKIPGIPSDAFISYCETGQSNFRPPGHIVVIYKGNMFSFEVVDNDLNTKDIDDIKMYLEEIVTIVAMCDTEYGVGIGVLTAMDRDTWSEIRVDMMEYSDNNKACLQDIEQALFVLSLDDAKISSPDQLVHEAIFADGCNRWYDKSLNFCVYPNGLVTVNCNTSIVDGVIVAFMLHYMHLRIMEDAEKWDDDVLMNLSRRSSAAASRVSSGIEILLNKLRSRVSLISETVLIHKDEIASRYRNTAIRPDVVRALEFDIDESLENRLEIAKQLFAELAATIRTASCKYEEYERNFFDDKKINKDAFAHMIMHLTFLRMYFRVASIGSKVYLLRFHHQRYEYMRATTAEVIEWCRLMLDADATFEQKKAAFWRAERKHQELLMDNCSGRGCENHLAALHVIAEDVYNTTPRLFSERSLCLTSGGERFDIYSESLGVGCPSGPVVMPSSSKGYGVGYFVVSTKVVFNVTCLDNETSVSPELFAISLRHSMQTTHHFMRQL